MPGSRRWLVKTELSRPSFESFDHNTQGRENLGVVSQQLGVPQAQPVVAADITPDMCEAIRDFDCTRTIRGAGGVGEKELYLLVLQRS